MKEKKLLEKKDWHYYIYEVADTIELSVPIPKPTPGFDISHTLNAAEKEKYLRTGIKALEERIADMKDNFSAYKMNAWR